MGDIAAKGTVTFATPTELNLELQIANLDVKEVLNAKWKDKLSGRIHGNIDLRGRLGPEGELGDNWAWGRGPLIEVYDENFNPVSMEGRVEIWGAITPV